MKLNWSALTTAPAETSVVTKEAFIFNNILSGLIHDLLISVKYEVLYEEETR